MLYAHYHAEGGFTLMNTLSAAPAPRRRILLLIVSAILLTVLLCSLTFLRFSSQLYIKRSPNTFVGDDKYTTVRQEVELQLEEYRSQGVDAVIEEQVIERVNSKNETTSLVIFTINAANTRSGWDLLSAGLPSSTLLILILALSAGAWIFTVYSAFTGNRAAGIASFVLSLAAFFLIPVIFNRLNLDLSRTADLAQAGGDSSVLDRLRPALDRFLFAGTAGDQLDTMLSALNYTVCAAPFLLLIPAFMSICASVLAACKPLKKTLLRVALYVSVILFSLFILYPFFVMFVTAFRSNAETTDMYFLRILPSRWVFSNLTDTLKRNVLLYLGNSLLIAGGATVIAMLCGIPAAYAMARMDFRGKKVYLGFVIMSQMFSPVVLLVGISRLMNTLHLNDTLMGLMFINAAFNQAFAIWLLRGTFVSISSEMEQAACIDGCSVLGAMLRILLPMAAPGIVTTLIFVFINAWNEYTVSTVLISTQTNKPITVGITQFSSFNMIEWQYLFAAALLATIPVVILFMLIEKHLAAGLTAGGVKG